MSQTVVPRVLVVGGTGHYGQHIVRSLAQRDAPVRGSSLYVWLGILESFTPALVLSGGP